MHHFFKFLLFALCALCLVEFSVVDASATYKEVTRVKARAVASPSHVVPAGVGKLPEIIKALDGNKDKVDDKKSTSKNSTTEPDKKGKKGKGKKGLKVPVKVAIAVIVVVLVVLICVIVFVLVHKKRQQKKRAALQGDIPPMAGPVGTMVEPTGYPNQPQGQGSA